MDRSRELRKPTGPNGFLKRQQRITPPGDSLAVKKIRELTSNQKKKNRRKVLESTGKYSVVQSSSSIISASRETEEGTYNGPGSSSSSSSTSSSRTEDESGHSNRGAVAPSSSIVSGQKMIGGCVGVLVPRRARSAPGKRLQQDYGNYASSGRSGRFSSKKMKTMRLIRNVVNECASIVEDAEGGSSIEEMEVAEALFDLMNQSQTNANIRTMRERVGVTDDSCVEKFHSDNDSSTNNVEDINATEKLDKHVKRTEDGLRTVGSPVTITSCASKSGSKLTIKVGSQMEGAMEDNKDDKDNAAINNVVKAENVLEEQSVKMDSGNSMNHLSMLENVVPGMQRIHEECSEKEEKILNGREATRKLGMSIIRENKVVAPLTVKEISYPSSTKLDSTDNGNALMDSTLKKENLLSLMAGTKQETKVEMDLMAPPPASSVEKDIIMDPGNSDPKFMTKNSQRSPLALPLQQLRRCAIHQYIAHNIHYHQQLMKQSRVPGEADPSFSGAKGSGFNSLQSVQNKIESTLTGGITENQNLAETAGPTKTDTSPKANMTLNLTKSKQLHSNGAPLQVPSDNFLHASSVVFPLGKHQAAAASSAHISGPSNSATATANETSSSAGKPLNSSLLPAGASTVCFNSSKTSASEVTPYVAILQNNGYPFTISTNVRMPTYNGGPQSPLMPFFNGSYLTFPMFHVSQSQQQEQSHSQFPGQPPHDTNSSSGSPSSQKLAHFRQEKSSLSNDNGFLTSTASQLRNPAKHVSSAHLSRKGNLEPEMMTPISVLVGDGESFSSQKPYNGQIHPAPLQPKKLAAVSPVMLSSGACNNYAGQQQQQVSIGGVGITASFAPLLNFSSGSAKPTDSLMVSHMARHGYESASVEESKNPQPFEGREVTGLVSRNDRIKGNLENSSTSVCQSHTFCKPDCTDQVVSTGTTVVDSSSRAVNIVPVPVSGNPSPFFLAVPSIASNTLNTHQQQWLGSKSGLSRSAASITQSLDFSSTAQQTATFQISADVAHQICQVPPAANVQHKKSHISGRKSLTGLSNNIDGAQGIPGGTVFGNSAQPARFIPAPFTSNKSPSISSAATVVSVGTQNTSQEKEQHQQRVIPQKQSGNIHGFPTAVPYGNSNSNYSESYIQANNSGQLCQWKNFPVSTSQALLGAMNFNQQHPRKSQGQTQICFGSTSNMGSAVQGQQPIMRNQRATSSSAVRSESNFSNLKGTDRPKITSASGKGSQNVGVFSS